MSTMLYALGRWCYRMRRRVVAAWIAVMVVLGGLAGLMMGGFSDEFEIPGTPSQVALDQLYMTFPEVSGTRATMVVVAPDGTNVEGPEYAEQVEGQFDRLEELDVVDTVASPYEDMIEGLVNDDRSAAMVNITLNGELTEITDQDRAELLATADEIESELPDGSRVEMGGDAFSVEIPGLSIVEVFGVIVALIVLLITLGSFVAASMPLINALLGVGASTLVLLAATGLMTISSTTPMLSVMLGLAVGIDYALFIISRHRDQLGDGVDPEESAARALATSGSAVVFAGITCIIALVGLSVAGIPFLTVMGIFASIGVAFAVLIAMTLLPAMMGFAGSRLVPGRKKGRRRQKSDAAVAQHAAADQGAGAGSVAASSAESEPNRAKKSRRGPLATWVHLATKWPWVTVLVVVVGLGALSVPAKDLELSLPNSGQHEATAPDRITYDLIEEEFGPGFNGPLIVTADIIQSDDPLGLMEDLEREVEAVPGVKLVAMSTPNPNIDTGFIQLIPETGPTDPATQDLVERLRGMQDDWEAQYGVTTAVTGMTAVQIDISDQLGGALLPFGIFVVGLSLILLTMVFRSIWVPIKTALGYLLSVGSAFGLTVLVFNQGHGKELVNLDQAQPIISFLPIILMGILFGLAMDYEVFLVSRMREEYAHGASASDAIRTGFVGSAKVVIAAACIMVAVFAFFVPEGEGPIKAIAFALAVGVAVDAFIVRMILVPAVLELLGDKAWWIPKWLDERLPTFDVEGDALARMMSLRDFGAEEAIRTEDFRVHTTSSGDLAAPVDLQVPRGDALVVEGDRGLRQPLLYALAGRVRGHLGTAKVLGRLLPEEGSAVRRRVAIVDAAGSGGLAGAIQRARRSKLTEVLIIDGADALPTQADRQALADVLDTRGRDLESGDLTVVLGVADLTVVEPLLHTTFHSIELLPPEVDEPEPEGHDPLFDPDNDRELTLTGGL